MRYRHVRRELSRVLSSYGGPLCCHVDVELRRRRLAALLRGTRWGWTPKLGLLRARSNGPGFIRERRRALRAAVLDALRNEGRL